MRNALASAGLNEEERRKKGKKGEVEEEHEPQEEHEEEPKEESQEKGPEEEELKKKKQKFFFVDEQPPPEEEEEKEEDKGASSVPISIVRTMKGRGSQKPSKVVKSPSWVVQPTLKRKQTTKMRLTHVEIAEAFAPVLNALKASSLIEEPLCDEQRMTVVRKIREHLMIMPMTTEELCIVEEMSADVPPDTDFTVKIVQGEWTGGWVFPQCKTVGPNNRASS